MAAGRCKATQLSWRPARGIVSSICPISAQFEGVGIYYGATQVEAQLCGNDEVAVVGAGNSAGQAAIFLAGSARHVWLLTRGPGLADSMSRYLVSRIEACREITVKPWTEIQSLEGDSGLKRITWRDKKNSATETHEIGHVFSMTGASPNTGWLGECLDLDRSSLLKLEPSWGQVGLCLALRTCSKPAALASLPLGISAPGA